MFFVVPTAATWKTTSQRRFAVRVDNILQASAVAQGRDGGAMRGITSPRVVPVHRPRSGGASAMPCFCTAKLGALSNTLRGLPPLAGLGPTLSATLGAQIAAPAVPLSALASASAGASVTAATTANLSLMASLA